jgi:rod shape determining protein RodA
MFRSRFRDFDWVLLGFVLVLSVISVLEIRSATAMTKFHGFQQKQMLFIGLGIVWMFAISLVDYHRLLDIANWAYGFSLGSLVAVLIPYRAEGAWARGGGSTLAVGRTSSRRSVPESG